MENWWCKACDYDICEKCIQVDITCVKLLKENGTETPLKLWRCADDKINFCEDCLKVDLYVMRCQQAKVHFEGQYKGNLKNGAGEYTHEDAHKYEGEYTEHVRCSDGYGVKNLPNGDRIEGNFVNWKPEGRCVYTFKNGDKFDGTYEKGVAEGQGKYTYKETEIKTTGKYVKGKRHGIHKMITPDMLDTEANFTNGK